MKEKGKVVKIEEKHNCDVCGEPAVVRDNDGHYYCFPHHDKYCSCIRFEQQVREWKARNAGT